MSQSVQPTIKIFTPPSSPPTMTGQEEWDNVDDFSVDSLQAEVSSTSTSQSTFIPSSPPEEITGDELPNDYEVSKNSSTELLQKMGHWFYNTRLVQYMKSDERSRVKQIYSSNSIWMLGIEYKFPEDCGSFNLPKFDRDERARSSRTSSFLNLVFGSSEEEEDYDDMSIYDLHHNDDPVQSHKLSKSRSCPQTTFNVDSQNLSVPNSTKVTPKVTLTSSLTGPNMVIQRLRSLSFTPKSPPLENKSFPDLSYSNIENRVNSGSSNSVYHRQASKRFQSFSFDKKSDSSDISQMDSKSSTIQTDNSKLSPPNNNHLQASNSRRSSITPNFLRNFSISNQGIEPSNVIAHGIFSSKPKKPRRMTFSGIFSGGKEKNKLGNSSRKLYPHAEIEGDLDSKFFGNESKLKYTSFEDIDNSRNQLAEISYSEDILYSSGDSDDSDTNTKTEEFEPDAHSGDNISVETVTRESIARREFNRFDLTKDADNVKNVLDDNLRSRKSNLHINTNIWHERKISDTGSVRSTGSFQSISTPTSLYKSDSLGPLSPNQKRLLDFYLDFQSRIFCCYRKDFLPIEPAFHTTDTGWGCMHRTGQSLLAQGFLWTLLGRDWRLHNPQTDSDILIYRKILRWFMDGPESEQYYSIHNIARTGIVLDKKIGDWFGPATIAHVLKRLSLNHKECPLSIYVPTDNTIYRTEVINIAMVEHDNNLLCEQKAWKPILILLSIRLGTDRFNPSYSENLKIMFTFPQFLGIAGGRPRKSLYFVAVQVLTWLDDEFFYLDPHFVRPAINLSKIQEFPIEDYHSTIVRAMDIIEMDPSMLLGFLCQRPQDFDELCERIKLEMDPQFPIFTIS
ncbi:2692_t:CDS:10 [Cetraspora pellucida]|uniref:Cysteine protease n=1 Tax=Cetraspora pellucida TaxID=1433469 RepID=A0A9N9G6Z7_9GLOM|nr:2692_t:CDS:10 [Cetraspora pellucida]